MRTLARSETLMAEVVNAPANLLSKRLLKWDSPYSMRLHSEGAQERDVQRAINTCMPSWCTFQNLTFLERVLEFKVSTAVGHAAGSCIGLTGWQTPRLPGRRFQFVGSPQAGSLFDRFANSRQGLHTIARIKARRIDEVLVPGLRGSPSVRVRLALVAQRLFSADCGCGRWKFPVTFRLPSGPSRNSLNCVVARQGVFRRRKIQKRNFGFGAGAGVKGW